MPAFRYVALDAAGHTMRGTMEAADERSVIDSLQRQGHIPMRAERAGRGGFLADFLATEFVTRRALKSGETAAVTRELATMLNAGQDLDRALRFVVETAPSERVRTVMDRVRGKVRGGSSLAVAIAQEPGSFSRLYVGLVRAGEAGGALGETLSRLAILLERERALMRSIQSATIYPSLLLVAAVGSITLLLTEVLPEFVPLFEENGASLPFITRAMIGLGHVVSAYGLWVLLVLLIAGLGARQALKNPARREQADRVLLRLPIVGSLIREALAARFCRTLGTLLRNGVPLITALGIVKEALGNLVAVRVIEEATLSARNGAGLARPLGEAALFPVRTIHLLRLGEETAQLAETSLRAAEIHEEETRLRVERLVALMVPAITVLMGIAIATIIASLMMAMLSLNDLAG